MAQIISQLREEVSQTLLENGSGGVGALQTRELGYTDEAGKQFLDLLISSSGRRQFPSLQRLDDAAAAASSGAKLIGYYPSNGMTSTDLQAAIDELRIQVAAGGGGTVLGTGTTGKLMKWLNSITATDSVLGEASGKINFSGDTVANFYRYAAGALATDGALVVTGEFDANGNFFANQSAFLNMASILGLSFQFDNTILDGAAQVSVVPSLTKNNSNARSFAGLRVRPTLNAGGSNSNTTMTALEVDTVNTSVTGVATRLLRLLYGGTEAFRFDSNGDFSFWNLSDPSNLFGSLKFASNDLTLKSNRGIKLETANNYEMALNGIGGGIYLLTNGFEIMMVSAGAGANGTDNYIQLGRIAHANAYLKMNNVDSGKEPTILGTGEVNVFMKSNCIVFQYNDGGTTRYKYLDLTGTGASWTHSTTAP